MEDRVETSDDDLLIPEIRQESYIEKLRSVRLASLSWWLILSTATIALSLAFFHLFVAAFGTPESRAFRSTHLAGMLVLAILTTPLWRKSLMDPIRTEGGHTDIRKLIGLGLDLIFIFLVLAIQTYTLYDLEAFQQREGNLSTTDVLAGSIFLLLVLEAARRVVGWSMVIITIFFVAHALTANYFPGLFFGPPVSYVRLIDILFVRADGIFGLPLMVAATYIVLFIIFGAILVRSGAGKFFLDLAISLTGHLRGGPAKASVVASAFLGTISGSAVANVATTGAFTIPLMKRIGYSPRFSAAVEACSSSGGQITPPIMGAAAFIIAEHLRVSYMAVLGAAIIPTILYFFTVYIMVDLEADKSGVKRIEKNLLPNIGEVLRTGWHQLLTLIVLIALLAIGYTAMLAAFGGIVVLFILSFLFPHTRLSTVDFLTAFETGIRNAVPVTVACACAGLIIGSIFSSAIIFCCWSTLISSVLLLISIISPSIGLYISDAALTDSITLTS